MPNNIEPRLSDVVSLLQLRVTFLYPNYREGDPEARTSIGLKVLEKDGLVQQTRPGDVWAETEAMKEDFRHVPSFFHEGLDSTWIAFFKEIFADPILLHCIEQAEPYGVSEEEAEKYVRGDHVCYEIAFQRAFRLFYLPVMARVAVLWELKEQGLIGRRNETPSAVWNPTPWAFFNNVDPSDKVKLKVCTELRRRGLLERTGRKKWRATAEGTALGLESKEDLVYDLLVRLGIDPEQYRGNVH